MVDVQPICTVEKPGFRELVSRLKAPNLIIKGRTFFTQLLEKRYKQRKDELILVLETATDIGVTIDLWSSRRKTYLGETAHWFNSGLLRVNACLGVKRIIGPATYEVLAKQIDQTHQEFQIDRKVSMATTDNGSNFLKCFRQFSKKSIETSRKEDEENDEENEEDFVFISIGDIFDEYEKGDHEEDLGHLLPPHQKCACHLLNLVCTKDVDKIQNRKFQDLRKSVEDKLQTLCNKQNMSSQHSDLIKDKLGKLFVVKNLTRWNSLYDSLSRLYWFMKNKPKELDGVMSQLGISHFNQAEGQYVREYLIIMKHIVAALDILQGEKNIGMGFLLPTLTIVVGELTKIESEGQLRHCKPLLLALLDNIAGR